MKMQTQVFAGPDEVFAPRAFDRNIGRRYDAGVLTAAEVDEDGKLATLTFETDDA